MASMSDHEAGAYQRFRRPGEELGGAEPKPNDWLAEPGEPAEPARGWAEVVAGETAPSEAGAPGQPAQSGKPTAGFPWLALAALIAAVVAAVVWAWWPRPHVAVEVGFNGDVWPVDATRALVVGERVALVDWRAQQVLWETNVPGSHVALDAAKSRVVVGNGLDVLSLNMVDGKQTGSAPRLDPNSLLVACDEETLEFVHDHGLRYGDRSLSAPAEVSYDSGSSFYALEGIVCEREGEKLTMSIADHHAGTVDADNVFRGRFEQVRVNGTWQNTSLFTGQVNDSGFDIEGMVQTSKGWRLISSPLGPGDDYEFDPKWALANRESLGIKVYEIDDQLSVTNAVTMPATQVSPDGELDHIRGDRMLYRTLDGAWVVVDLAEKRVLLTLPSENAPHAYLDLDSHLCFVEVQQRGGDYLSVKRCLDPGSGEELPSVDLPLGAAYTEQHGVLRVTKGAGGLLLYP